MRKADLLDHLLLEHGWLDADFKLLNRNLTRPELERYHTYLHTRTGTVSTHPATPAKGETMTTEELATVDRLPELIRRQDLTPEEGALLRQQAMAYVNVDGFDRPVPAFATLLPRYENDQAMRDSITAQLLTAPDPDRIPDEDGTIALQDLKNWSITIHSMAVRPSDLDAGWAFYLLLDVTEGDDGEHFVANTGAQDIVMRLAIAWLRDEMPLTGRVIEKPMRGGAKNRPLMFVAEKDFVTGNGQQQVGPT